MDGLNKLLEFLDLLERARVHYVLTQTGSNFIQVFFTLVGMRVEVDVHADRMSYRCFKGSEDVHNDSALLARLMTTG